MAQNINSVEIFSVGKHRGSSVINITESDLDEMVNSFNELGTKEGFRPVLKLGHEDAQKYFGQRKGAPNLGFVEKIWKEGSKILANFSNVPDALVELIKQRRYNAVSIEMFPKTEFGGQSFQNVLTAVALLGAELPAVKGLKELAATLFTEADDLEFTGEFIKLTHLEEDNMATFSQEQVDDLIAAAVNKARDEVKAEFSEQISELTEKVTAAEKDRDEAANTLQAFEEKSRTAQAESLVDDAIKDGKILPAQKDEILAFALSLTGSVKFGDNEKSAADTFKSFIAGLPKQVDLSEVGVGGGDKETAGSVGEEIDKRAKAMVKKDKIEYADAYRIVLEENPSLKQRYIGMEE